MLSDPPACVTRPPLSQLALDVCITAHGGRAPRDEQAIMLYNTLGSVLRYRGHYAQALEHAMRAESLSPPNTEVMASSLNNVANVLQNCNRWQESVDRCGRGAAEAQC